MTLHACMVCYAMYHHLILSIFNPAVAAYNLWAFNVTVLIHVLIVALVLIYFVSVIHRLCSKRWKWWITAAIAIPVVTHLAFAVVTISYLFRLSDLAEYHSIDNFAVIPMNISQVVADVFLAVALCLLLREKRTPFKRTQSMVKMMMIYAINRCILTSVVATVAMLAILIDKGSLWHIGCEFVLADMYVLSLMTTLNARNRICGLSRDGITDVDDIPLSDIRFETETTVAVTPLDSLHAHPSELDSPSNGLERSRNSSNRHPTLFSYRELDGVR